MVNDEIFHLVCLDISTEFLFEPYSKICTRYTDINMTMKFIESMRHTYILFIVSDHLAKETLIRLKNYRHIRNVFIFNQSAQSLKINVDEYESFVRIFQSKSELENAVQTQIVSIEKQALPFSVFDQKQRSSQDLAKKFNIFLWYQVLFYTLKQMPTDEQAKEEMLKFCSDYYQSNPREEQIIDDYRKSSNQDQAIHRYTRNTFFFKLANQALRTEDMLLVYRFRYWIKQLCLAIEDKHNKQNDNHSWILYSGFRLHEEEFERLKKSIGNLISINSFLSTSHNIDVARIFAGIGIIEPELVRVLLHIEVNPICLKPVFCADIQDISQFPEEQEVLFSLGSKFRILSIDYDNVYQYWIVQLIATDDSSDQIHEYCQLANYDFQSISPMIYFGKILNKNLDQGDHVVKYFRELLQVVDKTYKDLPEIYDALGDAYFRQYDIEQAIKCYKMERKIQRRRQITEIEPNEKIREKFIKQLEEEEKRIDGPTLEKANLLCNLASYSKYVQAGIYLTQALQIYEQLKLPSPSMSNCIKELAWNSRANEKDQQCLDLYYRCLAIEEEYLPADNQDLLERLEDIMNEGKTPDNYRQFIEFCQQKLPILIENLDENHPRVIHMQQCLEEVQNKLKNCEEKHAKWLIEVSNNIHQRDFHELSRFYHKIFVFYFRHGLYPESIQHLLKELEIYENIHPHDSNIFDILHNIAECYIKMFDYFQAFVYMEKAFKLAQSIEPSNPEIVQDMQNRIDNFVRRVAKYQIELPWIPLSPIDDDFFW